MWGPRPLCTSSLATRGVKLHTVTSVPNTLPDFTQALIPEILQGLVWVTRVTPGGKKTSCEWFYWHSPAANTFQVADVTKLHSKKEWSSLLNVFGAPFAFEQRGIIKKSSLQLSKRIQVSWLGQDGAFWHAFNVSRVSVSAGLTVLNWIVWARARQMMS